MRRQSFVATIAAILLSFIFCGCIIVINDGVGDGATRYVGGKLEASIESSLDNTIAAVKSTTTNFKFTTLSEKSDALSAISVLQTAQNKKIKIKMNKITDTTTKIEIGVGIIGDQALSYKMFEEIDKCCKKADQ